MSKNILLLVTGKTPQIITETLWALACDPNNQDQWVPDEIKVITTLDGIKEIEMTLLGREGIFQKMIREYRLPHIQFDKDSLIAITNKDNQPLADLKTPSDNEQAADKICNTIRTLTQNCNDTLHVSIAGGRKTMGFYAGYALSLYGRAQDALSHVLVSSEYEMLRGFFYPAKEPNQTNVKKFLKKIENNVEVLEEVKLDTYDAQVWLAKIPFVRLRASLPEKSLIKKANFSEVVASINLANEPIKVVLDCKSRKVFIGHKSVKLAPREFAFYRWFIELKFNQPNIVIQPIVEGEDRQILRLHELWKGPGCVDPLDPKSGTFDHTFFEQRLAMLKRKFTDEFTENVAQLIMIQHKNGKGSGYILPLNIEQIQIIDSFKN